MAPPRIRDARGHKRASSPTLYTLPVSGLVNQISTIVHIISDLRRSDVVIMLAEQNARAALQFSEYGYVLETGAVVLAAPSRDLPDDPRVAETYLGGDKRLH
jgi:ABC-type branched-subunit amino acid transport system ATPase component